MKFRFVEWELRPVPDSVESFVGLLTLNRPDRKNALGPRILLELDARLAEAKHSRANVVILRGEGGDFCAGGDLKEETLPLDLPEETWGLEGEYGELARWMINDQTHVFGRRVLAKLEDLPQPLIASIDGVAAGGGFEMAIACDLRIASDRLRMAEIAVSSGFVSEWSCPRNLPKLIGLAKATELILTGRFVEAEEALAIGLVNKVVSADDLEAASFEWASQIARLPAVGVRYAKEMIKMYNQDNRDEVRGNEEIERVLELMRRDEAAEGISALLEHRRPSWKR